jgi:hypothetical protein
MLLGTEWRRLNQYLRGPSAVVSLGKHDQRLLGRLVLEAFVGPCPQGMECCHFPDRDPANCRLDNLRWGTSKENTGDQRLHGTLIGGERHGMAKLADMQVGEIRELAGTMSQQKIADRFGIKQPHVSDILRGKKRTRSTHAGKGVSNG